MGTQSTARRAEAKRGALAKREREIAALARRQHGVISHAQLLAGGLSRRTIARRVESGRLGVVHRNVYVFGDVRLGRRGFWMAAVLACGRGALLSHRSAAALWALGKPDRSRVAHVSGLAGRGRPGIALHEGGIHPEDRAVVARIPVTSVARTLFDLAETVDEHQLGRAFEEADRLRLFDVQALEDVCSRGKGRRALKPVRRLIEEARAPLLTHSELEERFALLCREHGLTPTSTNIHILGREADAVWSKERLIVELDGFASHSHRAAFEDDRAKDAARQVAGYRTMRITDRRLKHEPDTVAAEIRKLLSLGSKAGRAVT